MPTIVSESTAAESMAQDVRTISGHNADGELAGALSGLFAESAASKILKVAIERLQDGVSPAEFITHRFGLHMY